jgi:hypothetical protein
MDIHAATRYIGTHIVHAYVRRIVSYPVAPEGQAPRGGIPAFTLGGLYPVSHSYPKKGSTQQSYAGARKR